MRMAEKNGWMFVKRPRVGKGARRGGAMEGGGNEVPPEFLQSPSVRVEEVYEAAMPEETGARRAAPPDLVLDVDVAPGEAAILAIRHPSGALTFHPSSERRTRSVRRGSSNEGAGTAQFRLPVRRMTADDSGRRGVVSQALKVVVVKVTKTAVDKAVSVALPKLAALWEKRTWTKRGLSEGWFRVTSSEGANPSLSLTPGVPKPGPRTLLLLHGTFSHAQGAFGALAKTDFFTRVAGLYEDRVYAFNHFSVSRTPEENARQLLDGLPAGEHTFDVITHSRGGLVLRSLVEHRQKHGQAADRFRLGHAVLVASPNDGTPLATPSRWEETVGWFANLMELFPDNPFTTGAEFVSEALVWLASHLAGDLPGLRAMDGAGEMVADLQSPPGPPARAYSALVSNFHPDAALWQRALDVGVDQFFGSANDLVVPSEGGWRIDRDGTAHVAPERIGCFGPGGNLGANGAPVHHINIFNRPETVDFLVTALSGGKHKLSVIDPGAPLPDRRFTRGVGGGGAAAVPPADIAAPIAVRPTPLPSPGFPAVVTPQDDSDAFHLVVMEAFDEPEPQRPAPRKRNAKPAKAAPPARARFARVFASYGGARVIADMRLRAEEGEPPTAYGEIINYHERIKNYTNRVKGTLPADDEMMHFGGLLFTTLFQGDVRRLYDEARSRQRGRRLDLVLTSMIPWIAEKPWEFCYDTSRASFLATEEIHFVRNVLTAVPSDAIVPSQGPLRILVASAQPVGFGLLSIDQELDVIRRGFEPLVEAGLAVIEVLPRATPAAIHGHLSTGAFNIVHFIGHGVFDEERQEGCLVFEDTRGGVFKLGQRSVREIFCQRGVSLVFLNACQSGAGGRSDFNKGVAQSLVAHGLPALVANQYSVLDSSATSFAQHFYWSLAQGQTLGQAAREARIAVNYSLHGELIDWAVPVLYARDANRVLAAKPATPMKVPTGAAASRTRRRGAIDRPFRVAVWDVDNVFPALERTLEGMNAAQEYFSFELVDMSAPLDAWDLESEPGTPYLWAERVAKRLQSKPVELRVNLLTCVTRHWLRDDEWFNLYGWWPHNRTPAVSIFSCAGFPDLPPEGPQTDRAISNTMVALLAGFLAEQDTHEDGASDCPMYFDKDRNLDILTGPQKFDGPCRRKLRRKLAKELPALDALLELG